ncbi:hypothetical protein F5884DRAFT_684207 [Xylogone sp. PMI_703]|nr:hypothetical protein F5884DRAFT_684207 [Xylogone sp. PMI_703]
MAASRFDTKIYTSEQFVESAGTNFFQLSTREICILHRFERDEYVLPKGRRSLGECRQATAIRETTEETGVPCRLLPVNLLSRVCPAVETGHGICEPIAMQQRRVGEGDVKFIWWLVAAVNEGEGIGPCEEDKFEVEFHGYDEALRRLTFKDDRKLVQEAIDLANGTLGV